MFITQASTDIVYRLYKWNKITIIKNVMISSNSLAIKYCKQFNFFVIYYQFK